MFVPTPSTTTLLNLVCKEVHACESILDMCTGNGWIAKALKQIFLDARVVASDIEPYKGDCEIDWRQGDLFESIRGEKFDLIVMNPPYVPSKDCEGCEPRIAYDGGGDGFEFIERFLKEFRNHLTPGGRAFIEIHATHEDRLPEWEVLTFGNDHFAIYRCPL